MAGALALAVLLGACSSGDVLDTGPAATGLDALVAAENLGPGEIRTLDSCPQDPTGSLLTAALDGIENPTVEVAAGGEREPSAGSYEGVDLVLVGCDRYGDEAEAVGLLVSRAPDDFDAYLEGLFLDPELVDPGTFEIDRRSSEGHRGGTFHQVCVADTIDPEFSSCEVDWIDDNLLITVYAVGPTALDVDVDQLQDGVAAILDDVVANLAG